MVKQSKILVLHGDRQTGELLLGRMASLKRKLGKKSRGRGGVESISRTAPTMTSSTQSDHCRSPTVVEMVAPDGPFVWKLDPAFHRFERTTTKNDKNDDDGGGGGIADNEGFMEQGRETTEEIPMRTWWYREGNVYGGLEDSLDMLLDVWNDNRSHNHKGGNVETSNEVEQGNGRFEGILGFSRGARLAHLIACLHTASGGKLFVNLKYVIIVAGYGHVPLPDNFPLVSSTGDWSSDRMDEIRWDGDDAKVQNDNNDDNTYTTLCGHESVNGKVKYNQDFWEDKLPLNIPSLHIMGSKDRLVTVEQSRALLSCYVNPVVHEHDGGHHVPMRAADVKAIVGFIDSVYNNSNHSNDENVMILGGAMEDNKSESMDETQPIALNMAENDTTAKIHVPDEEHAQVQLDECESLAMIFPDEFQLLSSMQETEPCQHGGDAEEPKDMENNSNMYYTHPISYAVQLRPPREQLERDPEHVRKLWPVKDISLRVEYTPQYPDSLPKLSLLHDMNFLEFKLCQEEACLEAVRQVAQAELGMPSIMSCVYRAREFFEEGGLLAALVRENRDRQGEVEEEEELRRVADVSARIGQVVENELDESRIPCQHILTPVTEEQRSKCIQEGLKIAYSILGYKDLHGKDIGFGPEFQNVCNSGKGGSWKFTIGLVGKPSAGKSTFFNAATAFARQRGGDEVDGDGVAIGGAAMAPHPFTTIDPNVGFCLVPTSPGSCPEDDRQDLLPRIACTHGRDANGQRLIPVMLKDVAGLVPGAYKGRGRGNKFLDDLTDADVLVHVLDSSGTADTEGNTVVVESDDKDSVASSPMNDLDWIFNELIQWVFMNIHAKWYSVVRKGRDKLAGLFSGYKQNQAFVFNILFAIETYLRTQKGRDRALDKLAEWDEGDLYRLVAAFLGTRFPVTLAMNKCDIPSASKFCAEITKSLPLHGAHNGTAICAQQEMNFVRRHIYSVLAPGRELKHSSMESPPHGVWTCLQSAMRLREPVLIFPVSDLETYEPIASMSDLAISDPSLPTKGMIACLKAAGGTVPSMWHENTSTYQVCAKGEKQTLRDVLVLKPGSTVEDAFSSLKGMEVIRGEFVRAEAVGNIGEKPKPVRKDDKLGKHNRILKIMTTKRREWQRKLNRCSFLYLSRLVNCYVEIYNGL